MRYTIDERELSEWLCRPQWQIYASASSSAGPKRFEVDTSAGGHTYRVTVRGETVFLGNDRTAAIAAYNDAH